MKSLFGYSSKSGILFGGESKRRLSGLPAHPVQGVLQRGTVDQRVQHLFSAGDIKERYADQNGEDPLSGEEQHQESRKTEEGAQDVSDDLDTQGDSGMALMSLFYYRGMDEEIIGRGPGYQKGDEQQTDQKGYHRKQAQSLKQG